MRTQAEYREKPWVLGIDTSCYTTSLALADMSCRIVHQQRLLLPVPAGTKGLRQSDAFFLHLRHLPTMMEELAQALPFPLAEGLGAVTVSTSPCRRQDSYMPVFLAGHALGRSLAASCNIPLYKTTHQENHLMAACWSCKPTPPPGPFLACHLSGGTTEIIAVETYQLGNDPQFSYRVLSGTLDIAAGQLIDRVGQLLGLPFPAGPHLEKLAGEMGEAPPTQPIPTYCRKGDVSFSGGEAWAKRALASGMAPAAIARAVEHYIGMSLAKAIQYHLAQGSPGSVPGYVLVMGGVAANQYLRQMLPRRVARRLPCYFSDPAYSTDNAVGTALIGVSTCRQMAPGPALFCGAGEGEG